MRKLIGALAIILPLTACQTTQTVQETQNFAPCTFPDSPAEKAPAWVCDVMPSDLVAGATGYAKKSAAGMPLMRKVAVNNARVALASQFQTDVSNMFKQAVEAKVSTDTLAGNSESVVEVFEDVTKNVVTRSLSNSKIIVSQVSPSGGLYVLVGMDQQAYDANIDKITDATKDSKLWNQFNNEKAADELSQALESLKSM